MSRLTIDNETHRSSFFWPMAGIMAGTTQVKLRTALVKQMTKEATML
jgi:hypothetical protein